MRNIFYLLPLQEELAANKALGSSLSLLPSSHVETKTVAGGILYIQQKSLGVALENIVYLNV